MKIHENTATFMIGIGVIICLASVLYVIGYGLPELALWYSPGSHLAASTPWLEPVQPVIYGIIIVVASCIYFLVLPVTIVALLCQTIMAFGQFGRWLCSPK